MANPHYRLQFGDTTFTKVFVGGLAWETPTEEMRRYFEQFGEILEAVVITDKSTGKSKGYGFVTFRDPESARRACLDPNPVIDGRRANCNIASLGRPRPSPPRGRGSAGSGGSPYPAGTMQGGTTSYGRIMAPPPPPPPPPPHIFYSPYGYATYTPEYGYPQAGLYNPAVAPQYYPTMYTTSPTAVGPPPYPYGNYHPYGQAAPGASFTGPQVPRLHLPLATYIRYPAQPGEGFSSPASWVQPLPLSPSTPTASRLAADPSSSDSQNQQQSTATPGVNTDNTSRCGL